MTIRGERPARYGSTTSSISSLMFVGSGRGVGEEAKLENSAEICRSRRTWVRMALTQSSSTGERGRPRSTLTRRACSADSWIGVSGFLMSWAT